MVIGDGKNLLSTKTTCVTICTYDQNNNGLTFLIKLKPLFHFCLHHITPCRHLTSTSEMSDQGDKSPAVLHFPRKDKKIGKYDLMFPVFPCLEGWNSCRGIPDPAPAPITGHETVITVRGGNQDDHHDQESGWGTGSGCQESDSQMESWISEQ